MTIAKLEAFLRDELPGSKLSDLYGKLFVQITSEHDRNQKFLEYALEILATAEKTTQHARTHVSCGAQRSSQ